MSNFSPDEIKNKLKGMFKDKKRLYRVLGITSYHIKRGGIKDESPADLIHEAALGLMEGRRKVDKKYKFDDLLLYTVQSIVRDLHRKNGKTKNKEVQLADREEKDELEELKSAVKEKTDTEMLSVKPEIINKLEKEEMLEYLYKTMDSDTTALVVLEERLKGFSNKEIAEEYNIEVSEVEKSLNRLKTRGKKY